MALVIKGNILTDKGNPSARVREDVKAFIAGVAIILTDGSQVVLEDMGGGDYFGEFAKGNDASLNAKASIALTSGDYKAPVKAAKKKVEREPVEIVFADESDDE